MKLLDGTKEVNYVRWMILSVSLIFCVLIAPVAVAHAEDGDGEGKGLLSGVLNQVESSVKDTTESVGTVVESAVEGVDQTVKDTVSFTKDTVETLTNSSTEQPVSEIVDRTKDFVEGTVDNVIPVVGNTTETVHTVTTSVTGIVKELPEVPVVSPVVNEVGKVVNETTEPVIETVEIVEIVEATDLTEVVIENETPALSESVDAPLIDAKSEEVIEQPVLKMNEETSAEDEVVAGHSPEIAEPTKPEAIDEDITFISNETPQQIAPSLEKQFAGSVKVKEGKPVVHETHTIPVESKTQWEGIPIAITTGTTSISSPVFLGGNADVVAGIMNGCAILHIMSGRQWIHSDEQMRIQWVHAPPGQPPQTTPFLQV